MRFLALLSVLSVATPALATDLLFSHRLDFTGDGSPLITVRIDEGEEEIVLVPKGPAVIRTQEGREIPAAKGERWRALVVGGVPARKRYAPKVAEVRFHDKDSIAAAIERWKKRGYHPRTQVLGAIFGIEGRVVDSRRYAVLLTPPTGKDEAERLLEEVRTYGEPVSLLEEMVRAPTGRVELRDPSGHLVATSRGAISLEGEGGIEVLGVEHDIGYAAHGRANRTYRGKVLVTVDSHGKTAAINALPLEDLLRGIVPSEIFASAPEEALKAQAVAARGEVLAKIGVRHLGDPYLLCAEQHCQVYKGKGGEHPRTDAAIVSTRGEVLLGQGGELVDAVYSSTCGGHTENNEAVWGTPPDPHLRGKPDGAHDHGPVGGMDDFLGSDAPGMCVASSFARPEKYRWVRKFKQRELDAFAAPLGVGSVEGMFVMGRGVSGRATGLRFVGTKGEAVVEGELRIRRLLGNLNSSLFVVEKEPGGGWRFRGAGWGHGVGMCQMGAIGRAERGDDHVSILGHYYTGARPMRLY